MSKSYVKASQKKRRISNRERDDLNHLEEQQNEKLAAEKIVPPDFLSRKQKNTFKKLAESLSAINVVSTLDADLLAHYVYFQSVFEDLKKLVDEEGFITGGKVHPALSELRQLTKTISGFQNKLGLNPTDRLRFVDKVEESEDEFDEFINDND